MMSRAEARKQRRELQKQIEKAERQKQRETLARLREDLRALKMQRRDGLARVKETCRADREQVRVRIKELRRRAFEELGEATRLARQLAKDSCSARKEEVKITAATAIGRARSLLEEERKYRRDLKRIERDNRIARRGLVMASRKERRSESDDEVRANISPELAPLFERVKHQIRASSRMSRTEAFLQYVHENPAEAYAAIDADVDRQIAELERQAERATRIATPRRRRARPASPAASYAHVPF